MIKLEIIGGPEDGKIYKLSKSVSIGRDLSCDIPINYDKFSSRAHAKIEQADKNWVAKDFESTNGTFVNNEKINERQLRDNDILKVGRVLFRVNIY